LTVLCETTALIRISINVINVTNVKAHLRVRPIFDVTRTICMAMAKFPAQDAAKSLEKIRWQAIRVSPDATDAIVARDVVM
jgi:hypothetical protein